jgi:flavin reductase (DIM6/NTAB) family NADH-FMN oxidoreductase RutF
MKKKLGAKNALYPLPTTLVGAIVEGKPTFTTIAHVGIMDLGSVSLGINKVHYINDGIKEHQTFSINIPSESMVKITDYCGLVTGKKTDKSRLFSLFYGVLETAPLIEECPINMECRLIKTVDFFRHDIFVGEVIETHVDESVVNNGVIDLVKVKPLLFSMFTKSYWTLGKKFAQAWAIGKSLKEKAE